MIQDILFCVDIGFKWIAWLHQAIHSLIHPSQAYYHQPESLFVLPILENLLLGYPYTHNMARKEFSSDIDAAVAALRGLSVVSSGGQADLSQLFRIAAHEAKKSHSQNRILRVILLYCRSSVEPQFQWPALQKLFTLDVVYLHDKPGPNNCPQKVYDALVVALEHVTEYEGYIFETGQGLQRILFRYMSLLLSHPQQRCMQDDLGLPMPLTKKAPATDSSQGEDTITVSSQ